ncbi:MAG TPA: hypothetical protein VFX20_13900 [Steroidobacteraceae bacterium]|nr:hypothetical protein [Steroidobacteraceae bacterium]
MSADVTPIRPSTTAEPPKESPVDAWQLEVEIVGRRLIELQARAYQLHAILKLIDEADESPAVTVALCAAVSMAKELADALEMPGVRRTSIRT